jgi:3-oxoacyl-[acyl-carrier-protein] synthase-3
MPTRLLGLAHDLPPDAPVAGVTRPIVSAPVGPSDLALEPARRALAMAGSERHDVDFIVFATMTPDVTFPGAACFFQDKLDCGTVGALDVRGQCAGFLLGLMIADGFLAAGVYRRVLLAAAEVHSSMLDYSPRGASVAALYGDGVAVAVLGDGGGPGLESIVCHSDGRHHQRFWCEYPASRQHPVRITVENLRAGRHYPALDVPAVEQFGRGRLPGVVNEALSAARVTTADVDCFLLSHVLPGVARKAAERLAIPPAKLIDAGAAHGHLTAATLPVALSEAIESRRLRPGMRVCLATCGAGFAWGAAVLTL